MSYIRSKDTYAYDTDEGLIIHTNNVIEQDPIPLTKKTHHDVRARGYRYMVTIPQKEFEQMIRRILEQAAPGWAKNKKFISTLIADWKKDRANV